MLWSLSWRADPRAKALADQHYNRQNPDAAQFVPPGRCLVLYAKTRIGRAFWVTSYPFAEHVKHAWAGAFVCSAFRNEGADLSSTLIQQAVAATRWKWPEVPPLGMVTFVDPAQTTVGRSPFSRPGKCYAEAGFQAPKCPACNGRGSQGEPVEGDTGKVRPRRSEERRRARRGVRLPTDCPACFGTGDAHTAGGLPALQMLARAMPPPEAPLGAQSSLFSTEGWT